MTGTGTDGRTMVDTLVPPLQPTKPRFRGVLHQIAFLASIPLGFALVAVADTPAAKVAALVYSLGACALYGTSAAYHRGHWSERGRAWMRRLDHSMIFVLIAATYPPICVLGLDGSGATMTLIGIWATPAMSMTHLLLAATMTAYVLIAISYEEKDLVTTLGKHYVDYQKRVRMIIPLPK